MSEKEEDSGVGNEGKPTSDGDRKRTIEEEYNELLELGKCIDCQWQNNYHPCHMSDRDENAKCLEELKNKGFEYKEPGPGVYVEKKEEPSPSFLKADQSKANQGTEETSSNDKSGTSLSKANQETEGTSSSDKSGTLLSQEQITSKVKTNSVGSGNHSPSRTRSRSKSDQSKPKTIEEEYRELLEIGKCIECQWQKNYHPCLMSSELKDNEKCIEAMRLAGYEYREPGTGQCPVMDDSETNKPRASQTSLLSAKGGRASRSSSKTRASHLQANKSMVKQKGSKSHDTDDFCKEYFENHPGESMEYINKLHPHITNADTRKQAHIIARDNLVPLPSLKMGKYEKCLEQQRQHGHHHGVSIATSKRSSKLKKPSKNSKALLSTASKMQFSTLLDSENQDGGTGNSYEDLIHIADFCRVESGAVPPKKSTGPSETFVPTTTPSENADIIGTVETAIRGARKSLGGEPKKLIVKGLNQKDEEGLILCAPVKPFAEMDEQEVRELVIEIMQQAKRLEEE